MTSVLQSLNQALHQLLQDDPRVYLIGEDLADPYGGAFKVTQGCSDKFPGRVISTPISEAAIVGIGAGMALRGLHPVVEIMFGDFITLAADQLVNHVAKFRWMYNEQVSLPLVIRTPMGGRRGYGPTHSQTLEKLLLGVPGLRTVAVCNLGDPGELLRRTITDQVDPTLFIENKLLYPLPVKTANELKDFEVSSSSEPSGFPSYHLAIHGAPRPQLTLAAYGYMAELAIQAAHRLAFEEEIFSEVVIVTQCSPTEIEPILVSATASGALLTIEEGSLNLGWGAEVLARVFESPAVSKIRAGRIAAHDHPIPASPALESACLPGVDEIIQKSRILVKRKY